MKKLLIIIMVLTMSISLHAQQFAGVSFGMPYDKCKIILDRRFNDGVESEQLEKGFLIYTAVNFAGMYFDSAYFGFKQTTVGRCLFSASFTCAMGNPNKEADLRLAHKWLNALYKKYLAKKPNYYPVKKSEDYFIMYDEEDYPQIKCGITKNDGEINLFIKYGPAKIAGEDDDI